VVAASIVCAKPAQKAHTRLTKGTQTRIIHTVPKPANKREKQGEKDLEDGKSFEASGLVAHTLYCVLPTPSIVSAPARTEEFNMAAADGNGTAGVGGQTGAVGDKLGAEE